LRGTRKRMARDKSPPLVGSGLGPVSGLVRGRSLASGSGAFPCSAHSGIRRSRAILAQHLPLRGQLRNYLFRRPDEGAPDSRFNRRVATVTSGGAKSISCAVGEQELGGGQELDLCRLKSRAGKGRSS